MARFQVVITGDIGPDPVIADGDKRQLHELVQVLVGGLEDAGADVHAALSFKGAKGERVLRRTGRARAARKRTR